MRIGGVERAADYQQIYHAVYGQSDAFEGFPGLPGIPMTFADCESSESIGWARMPLTLLPFRDSLAVCMMCPRPYTSRNVGGASPL